MGAITPSVATNSEDQPTASSCDQVRFDADFKQQQDRADLGHDADDGIGLEGIEQGDPEQIQIAEQNAHQQFTQNGRLAQASDQLAAQLGGDDDQRQDHHGLPDQFADVGSVHDQYGDNSAGRRMARRRTEAAN